LRLSELPFLSFYLVPLPWSFSCAEVISSFLCFLAA
jgi:hypothetical protein